MFLDPWNKIEDFGLRFDYFWKPGEKNLLLLALSFIGKVAVIAIAAGLEDTALHFKVAVCARAILTKFWL